MLPLLLLAVLAACQNGTQPPQSQKSGTTPPEPVIEQSEIMLICQPVEAPSQSGHAPAYEVFVQLADSKVKVADIYNCETLTPEFYEQYQIPRNAISAVGGWWAGAGDYLYLIEEGEKYVVKKGEMHEKKESNGYDYQTVASFSKKVE